jgi:hypothetical protein
MVEVGWIAADADLNMSGLDGAVKELGGHTLGELNVHVHFLQCLVPLKDLLPVVDEGVPLLRSQFLCHVKALAYTCGIKYYVLNKEEKQLKHQINFENRPHEIIYCSGNIIK